jgi:hypothetical protein
MELFYIVIACFVFLICVVSFIALFLKYKKHSYLVALGVSFVICILWSGYWISENVRLHLGESESIALWERPGLVIDGFKKNIALTLYNPCSNNGMDAPVDIANSIALTQMHYPSFVVILPHDRTSKIHWIPNAEENDYLVSLPRAAHGLEKVLNEQKTALPDKEKWMFQLIGIDKVLEETAFVFIVGHAHALTECPKYFKQQFKMAVTHTHKVYQFVNDVPKYIGDAPWISTDELPLNYDFVLNILDVEESDNLPILPQ